MKKEERMKERPIIFNGEMVRAILDGRKTQTRRVIKPQPIGVPMSANPGYSVGNNPYGQPGDRLWVRETCFIHSPPNDREPKGTVYYVADIGLGGKGSKPTPSIHMPRWASRILLEITDVRVERVQDISEEDARAEGVETKPYGDHPFICTRDYSQKKRSNGWFPGFCADTGNQYRSSFRSLWDSINAKRGYGWDINPWVWVVEFKAVG